MFSQEKLFHIIKNEFSTEYFEVLQEYITISKSNKKAPKFHLNNIQCQILYRNNMKDQLVGTYFFKTTVKSSKIGKIKPVMSYF